MLFNGESGVISALDAEQVMIEFDASDACDSCGLKIVCAPGKESSRTLSLKNPGNLSLGQRVRVDEMSNLELHLASTQFGLPMLLFLLGLFVGYTFPLFSSVPRELMAFVFALVGLAVSYPLAKYLVQKIADLIPKKYLRIVALD